MIQGLFSLNTFTLVSYLESPTKISDLSWVFVRSG